MNDIHIRRAKPADLPFMQTVFTQAKLRMHTNGNPHQWTGSYPDNELLLRDMERGFSYIAEKAGQAVATFVLALCTEPTYATIEDGQWLDDTKPYGTIHRIAALDGQHGIMQAVLDYAGKQIDNLRVDTHRDNAPMHHLLLKYGFTRCGIIHLANGDERIAYQRLDKPDPKAQD